MKLPYLGYAYDTICAMLDVSPGFITQAKTAYEAHGTAGLTLKYQESLPFLSADDRQAVIDWLKLQKTWSVADEQ